MKQQFSYGKTSSFSPSRLTTQSVWRRKVVVGLACLFGGLVQTVQANPAFLVAPSIINVDLRHPATQLFIITNTGNEQLHLRIKPIYVPADDHTIQLGKPIDAHIAKLENLLPYMLLSPQAVSLRPGEERDVRLSIRAPAHLPVGEYRAHLLVSMLPTSPAHPSQKSHRNNVGAELNLAFETAVAIYGHIGQGDPQLTFSCQQKDNKIVLTNTSPWKFSGNLDIFDLKKHHLAKHSVISLRNTRQVLAIKDLPHQKDILIQWQADHKKSLQGTTRCHFA